MKINIAIDSGDLYWMLSLPMVQAELGPEKIAILSIKAAEALGGNIMLTDEKHPAYDFVHLRDFMIDEMEHD